jgi:hypothetical protein
MLSISKVHRQAIYRAIYYSDRETRDELHRRVVKSENEYTSRLLGKIRDKIKRRKLPGISVTAETLSKPEEIRAGCDAMLVISDGKYHKIGRFEAKWPRISQPNYRWDNPSGHFSSQLKRQSALPTTWTIWEMFYCELQHKTSSPYFSDYLYACSYHADAYAHDLKNTKKSWTQKDVQALLKAQRSTMSRIAMRMCDCKDGTAIQGLWRSSIDMQDLNDPQHLLVIECDSDDLVLDH